MIDSHVLFERIGSFHKWKDLDLITILEYSVLAPNPTCFFRKKIQTWTFYFSRKFMWFKNEVGRDPVFCDIQPALSKECCSLWVLATKSLFRALTYFNKCSLSLPSGYSKVWAQLIKTDLTNWGSFWIIEIRRNFKKWLHLNF